MTVRHVTQRTKQSTRLTIKDVMVDRDEIKRQSAKMPAASKRLSIGVAELDIMLGGGIPVGYSTLLVGPSGSGKTVLATEFLTEGVRAGEAGVIAAFEKSPNQLLSQKLDDLVQTGQVGLIDTHSLDLSIDETLHELVSTIRRLNAKRVVIDSLSGFELALAPAFQEDFRESLYRLVAVLTVYPAGFVSFAQECGVMLPIGRWVLREACEQARRWEEAGLAIDVVAVNISAPEFECNDFLEYLLTVLHETGLSPHRLELELTESVLMRDCEATIQKLNTLRSLGIRIAIDDFGTGYSSLSYLKRFPIDTLKIDQSFVRNIRSGVDDILVDAVITIGTRMQHQVIAEGIETAEQLEFLRAHQCTSGQGFHLGKPISAEDFTHILKCQSQEKLRTPLI